jgi:hypothetical protein
MGGVGKTALALHLAHELRAEFADGQLYVDLHGTDTESRPVAPREILNRFLRILGVCGDSIPHTLDERAGLFRGLLSSRRVLIVLDNAADEAQVVPLLPGSPTCAVVVTSRRPLGALAAALHVDLDVLSPSEAMTLLERMAGPERLNSDLVAAQKLLSLCGYLPLTLRIIGAHLGDKPRQLDEPLDVGGAIALSYEDLDSGEQRAFRRLGLLDVTSFPPWVAAAALGTSAAEADRLVGTLVDAQLLQVTAGGKSGAPRYCFHDLVRVHAREMSKVDDSPEERRQAVRRMLSCMVSIARQAGKDLFGGEHQVVPATSTLPRVASSGHVDVLVTDPVEWFESERPAIISGIHQAAHEGHEDLSWDLACATAIFFSLGKYLDDLRSMLETACAAGDPSYLSTN